MDIKLKQDLIMFQNSKQLNLFQNIFKTKKVDLNVSNID